MSLNLRKGTKSLSLQRKSMVKSKTEAIKSNIQLSKNRITDQNRTYTL